VNKKNNWEEIAGYLYWQRFGSKEVWTSQKEKEWERWHVLVEEQAVEGSVPKWRPVVRQVCNGETAPSPLLLIGPSYF
jgi:hypothetical protein